MVELTNHKFGESDHHFDGSFVCLPRLGIDDPESPKSNSIVRDYRNPAIESYEKAADHSWICGDA